MHLEPTESQIPAVSPKTQITYVLPLIDRIGHLTGEPFRLRNVYPSSKFDITFVTFPPEHKPRTNISMYNIALRGAKVAHSTDPDVIWAAQKQGYSPAITKDGEIINLDVYTLLQQFNNWYSKNKRIHYQFSLSEEEIARGNKLREKLKIPLNAKIITLHCRESGYLPQLQYHSYRDANIQNYIPAMEYLLKQGYYIVRLGDNSMAKIEGGPAQLIDAPFHPDYSDFFDPYFVSSSEFFIGTAAGPIGIARGFQVPILIINAVFGWGTHGLTKDLLVPKHLYSPHLGRNLTYLEIIQSPLLNLAKSEDFNDANITVRENSAEEILSSVKEMEARINGTYEKIDESTEIHRRIRVIEQEAYEDRHKSQPNKPLFVHSTDTQFSLEFLKLNPSFLGHPWRSN